jgi:hypothetical protein
MCFTYTPTKFFERLRLKRSSDTKNKSKLGDIADSLKYQSWEESNYKIEEFGIPPTICKQCKNKITVIRSSMRLPGEPDEVDDLRFEQDIKGERGSKGRCVMQVDVGRHYKRIGRIQDGDGNEEKMLVIRRMEGNDLVVEEHCADVKCMGCGNLIVYWLRVYKYDGEDGLRWFLQSQDPAVSKPEVREAWSSTSTLGVKRG